MPLMLCRKGDDFFAVVNVVAFLIAVQQQHPAHLPSFSSVCSHIDMLFPNLSLWSAAILLFNSSQPACFLPKFHLHWGNSAADHLD
jgi:hypothetical protein